MHCPLPQHDRPLLAVLGLVFTLAAILAIPGQATALDDRHLDYHTITTDHFHVHYYDGLEALARRTASIAEESHTVLTPILDWKPGQKTHILVTDQQDVANGFARIFGRNFITIYGKPPTPEGNLGYYDDWLRVLIYHEYVHILHLDTNPGIPQAINRVIGKQYHPHSLLPRWYIEGIAVYLETVRTGRARANSPLFRMWLRTAALEDELFDIGKASGLPFRWPTGTTVYLYGAFFIDYMARHFGEDFIRDFNHDYGERPIPYGMNHITEALTEADLLEHWEGFIDEARAEAEATRIAVESRGRTPLEVLTNGGGRNRYPTLRPDHPHPITFHRNNLTDTPVFASIAPSGQDFDEVRSAHGAAGPGNWSPDGQTFYFSRRERTKNVYSYQDLFAYTPATGRLHRLTEADRAREPAISPDGQHLVHVRNRAGSMELVQRPLRSPSQEEVLLGRHDFPDDEDGHWQQISSPTYTPDGSGIVFSWWRLDRRQRDLYLFDLSSRTWERLTDSPAHDMDPSFGPDGMLYFTADVDGIFNIHAMDLETRQTWQMSNVLRGVFHPQVSPDGWWIYVYTYTTEGFEIARFRHPGGFYHPDRRRTERDAPWIDYPEPDLGDAATPRDYQPFRWLKPMLFEPNFGLIAEGTGIGATISGYDPIEHHEYTLSGGWTTGSDLIDRSANLGLQYAYRGAPINVSTLLRLQDTPRTSGLFAESRQIPYLERQYLGNLSLSYPIRRHDHTVSVSTSYRVDYRTERERPTIQHEPGDRAPSEPNDGFFNELQFGISYSRQERYPYSISTERGLSGGATFGLNHPSLGHPDSAVNLSYRLNLFRPNPLADSHVFALRLRGAINRSQTGRVRRYSIGGHAPQDVFSAVVFQEPRGGTPIRGYPPGLLTGSQYQTINLEYRFPILRLDQGLATLPLFFRNLKGSVFVDHGTAYDGYLTHADYMTGVGAEIQLDGILGYRMSNSLRTGLARGLDEGAITEWYLLFGGAF